MTMGTANPLSLAAVFGLILFTCLMSTGQILFKYTATRLGKGGFGFDLLVSLLSSPFFVSACLLYAISTVLWVVILSRVPLSIAYPITSLSLVVVPIFSYVIFQDKLGVSYFVGTALIMSGIWVIAFKGA